MAQDGAVVFFGQLRVGRIEVHFDTRGFERSAYALICRKGGHTKGVGAA
ncbi:hypothetical protein [Streptomyces sp. NPDC007264]